LVQAVENAKNPFLAAKIVCSFLGTEKSVQRAAAIIEQNWINVSGLPDKAAVATIALRLDEARYDAGKKQLCSSLVVSDRMPPETHLFMKTRNHLFGHAPGWVSRSSMHASQSSSRRIRHGRRCWSTHRNAASTHTSKNQIAGCETGLRADFMHVFGTHATEEEAIAALSEPIASLLFTRLVACEKATSESVFAESLGRLHDRDDDERALPRHEARAELLAAHLGRGARAADRVARRGQGLLGSVRAQSRARPRSRHRRSPCHRQRHRHGVVEH